MIYFVAEATESNCFGRSDKRNRMTSKAEVNDELILWRKEHDKVGTDPNMAFLEIYATEFSDYPDFRVKMGPKGRALWETC